MSNRPELAWLVHDRDSPMSGFPLGAGEVGAAGSNGGKTTAELELIQVVDEARAASPLVLTYNPDRYTAIASTSSTSGHSTGRIDPAE
ncbi:MAG TPA: hypothetical protein VF003_18330 [Pseudonocardiaceae bacterium]